MCETFSHLTKSWTVVRVSVTHAKKLIEGHSSRARDEEDGDDEHQPGDDQNQHETEVSRFQEAPQINTSRV